MPDDIHGATAKELFGEVNADTRARAKTINYATLYGTRRGFPRQQLAECEGAQQNETDGAAEMAECLLSDLHHSLHRGERCPECGYCFEDIG